MPEYEIEQSSRVQIWGAPDSDTASLMCHLCRQGISFVFIAIPNDPEAWARFSQMTGADRVSLALRVDGSWFCAPDFDGLADALAPLATDSVFDEWNGAWGEASLFSLEGDESVASDDLRGGVVVDMEDPGSALLSDLLGELLELTELPVTVVYVEEADSADDANRGEQVRLRLVKGGQE